MDEFQPLDNDEVLFVSLGRVLMANPTFKVGEFIDALAQAISDREEDWVEENEGWFNDGLDCQALRFSGQGWQRGRVRIRLEFLPDSPKARLPERRTEQPRRLGKLEPRPDAPSRSDPNDAYRLGRSESNLEDFYGSPDDDY
ncbi:KGK domain-containing protein [Leptolyngbyaceae cyanobacterium UHCC 1019]